MDDEWELIEPVNKTRLQEAEQLYLKLLNSPTKDEEILQKLREAWMACFRKREGNGIIQAGK